MELEIHLRFFCMEYRRGLGSQPRAFQWA